MRVVFVTFVFALLAGAGIVSANGASAFPAWTYYAEIIEHIALIIASLAGIALIARKKGDNSLMITGLIIIIVSQVLVNLHHFLIYPFGIWNAVIHHGLLLIGIIIIILAYLKGMK